MKKKSLRPQPVKPVIRMNSSRVDDSMESVVNANEGMFPSGVWDVLEVHPISAGGYPMF